MPRNSIFNGQTSATKQEAKAALVRHYDAIHTRFAKVALDDHVRAEIERMIIDSHIEFLLLKGKDKQDAQRKELLAFWHTDRKKQFTPAMTFIEGALGNAHAYKLIDICIERMQAKQGGEADHSEMADIILAKSVSAPTYTERLFYRSLISMVCNAGGYTQELPKTRAGLVKLGALMTPMIGSVYCISFFAGEIVVGLMVSSVLGYSSRNAGKSHQTIGSTTKTIADHLWYVSTALPAMVISGNFTAARYAVGGMKSVIGYITGSDAGVSDRGEMQLQEIPLRVIVLPLTEYIDMQSQQIAAGFREGASKRLLMMAVVQDIHKLSKDTTTLAEKLDKIRGLLAGLSFNPVIKDSGVNAMNAVKAAQEELDRAQKALVSADDRHYYEVYHGMTLPLTRYLKQYSAQWVASWRSNAKAAAMIKEAVDRIDGINQQTSVDRESRLERMADTIKNLQMEASRAPVDVYATKAIDAAVAAGGPSTHQTKTHQGMTHGSI